jgi:chemotaxis protein methyltransferase CheR
VAVNHPMDRTLALLKDVMSAHSASLAGKPESATPAVPAPMPEGLHERRSALAVRLMQGVERHAGLQFSAALAEKLVTLIAPMSLGALDAWVMELEQLPSEAPDWRRLSESLTVHETYFLRDRPQLSLLSSRLPGLVAEAERQERKALRFWSVGCATGEEAYSLAMLGLDALVASGKAVELVERIQPAPPWRIEVLGSDLSGAALAQAERGRYETGPLSPFRDLPPAYLRYVPPIPGETGRQVRQDLRAAVRFGRFNLARDLPPEPGFDVVLCRNVLIYLADWARRRAVEQLCRAVRPGGYLMLGATDALDGAAGFETIWGDGAVMHRRIGDG